MNRLFVFALFVFCSSSFNSFGQWSFKYYVDDFGDKTNESYISYTDYNGVFSNSATSGSKLIVNLLVSYSNGDSIPDFRFDLYEYGRGPSVGKQIGDATYTLNIKLSNSTSESYDLRAGENSLYIRFQSDDAESFLKHLKKESLPIKCYLEIDGEYSSQSYLFKINPIGFSNAHSKIYKKLINTEFEKKSQDLNPASKITHKNLSESNQLNDRTLNEDNSIADFASVEVMPEFPGGQAGWGKYLEKSMKYPPIARENNITGRVIVSFVVEKNGELTDIVVVRGIGSGCDEEALRLLKNSPSWKPGIQNGRSVRVAYTIPIFFMLKGQ